MQSVQTSHLFGLSQVKPLEGILSYRAFCLEAVKKALKNSAARRELSPVDGEPLQSWEKIGGLEYLRSSGGSLFLADLPSPEVWGRLLTEVCEARHSPKTFHADIRSSRLKNVLEPKLHWIQNALRLQNLAKPKLLEVITPPSDFTNLLRQTQMFSEVLPVNETDLLSGKEKPEGADAAVLLESLDRSGDPAALLQAAARSLKNGGMLFLTALVASGFDATLLGKENAYLVPPDRANFFSLKDLKTLVSRAGFQLLEVSTPGVLDVEVVKSHWARDPNLPLSAFERSLLTADAEIRQAFQDFLQQSNLSSFARIVGQKLGASSNG